MTYDDWKAHDDTPFPVCEDCGLECAWATGRCTCCDVCVSAREGADGPWPRRRDRMTTPKPGAPLALRCAYCGEIGPRGANATQFVDRGCGKWLVGRVQGKA